MKILRQPDVTAWRGQATCKTCHAELEVELADLTLHTPDYVPGEFGSTSITCGCPVCCATVYVHPVPAEMHHAIKRAR